MASNYESDRPEDFLASDFLFQEADAFALPLLDFDPDGALLSPAEQQEFVTPMASRSSSSNSSSGPFGPDPSSPVSTDGGSTDAEAASPPPTFVQQPPRSTSCSLHSSNYSSSGSPVAPSSTPPAATSTSTNMHVDASKALTQATPFPGGLPYALPVAYFPPLNANQKRPFPQVLPGAASSGAPAAASTDATAKKSKREIRQMKNRESANKSRLRRKAQLSSLSTEVDELTKKQQELQTVIAGLRAENKSLHDQNAFLRSLVTGCKQEPPSSLNNQLAAFASLAPLDESCVALNVLESGQGLKMDVDIEGQPAGGDFAPMRPGKRRAVTSTLSTASMAVCASVFGITVFADYDGGAAHSANVRGVGRVLHEASTACGVDGCASSGSSSLVEFVLSGVSSWWQFLSSSELVFGVLLNVLSFIAIMTVYQLWQSRSSGARAWKCPTFSKSCFRGARRLAEFSVCSGSSGDEMKHSKSARDVRQQEKLGRGQIKA